MAPDDEKTTVEVPEGDGAEDVVGKKGPSKLILFGGIGLGVVVIGVVLALFVLKPMMASSDAEGTDTEVVENADKSNDSHAEKPKPKPKKKSGGHGDAEEGALIYAVKDIVVNPAGTGGTRFLSISFGFELGSHELVSEFEERELVVRDALITILSSKTVAQLTDAKQKEIVRYQVKKRLEMLLDTDEIEGVYYTDFVLQ
ncbi:MAG: flagellar basal body-associated FliL family protein [candidate division Zixibacteria bacterium]|nr:flagellar basal body-associated FliL family protein [candidate division Zixibacteria bacterium]